jgi:quercetin dioxygenase-like cupin family protein
VERNLKIIKRRGFIKMNQNRLNALEGDGTCSTDDEEHSPYLKELKQRLSDLIKIEEGSHIEYYAGAEGDALYKDKDVGVQMLFMAAGSQFPEHTHSEEKEWLIIIKGSATVWIDGVEHHVKARDHIVIEPGQDHSGHANEDLWHIAISIPADDGYPNVVAD